MGWQLASAMYIKPNWCTVAGIQALESDMHVLHFLSNGVGSKGVSILCVNFKSVVNRGGYLDPELYILFQIAHLTLLHEQDNACA